MRSVLLSATERIPRYRSVLSPRAGYICNNICYLAAAARGAIASLGEALGATIRNTTCAAQRAREYRALLCENVLFPHVIVHEDQLLRGARERCASRVSLLQPQPLSERRIVETRRACRKNFQSLLRKKIFRVFSPAYNQLCLQKMVSEYGGK